MPSPIRALRLAHRLTVATTAGGLLLVAAPTGLGTGAAPDAGPSDGAGAGAVEADLTLVAHKRGKPWPGHPGRRLVRYTVRSGDTAGGLAVRFHAWTAELLRVNHLAPGSVLYVGDRIRIPVVTKAARKDHKHHAKKHKPQHHKPKHHKPKTKNKKNKKHHHPWRHAKTSRAGVRSLIIRSAHQHGVPARLALAIAWQESGWQQRRISSAHAIGVMQVLPSTAEWMSWHVGHKLNPYRLGQNITAGVVLLKVLRSQTRPPREIAAYYQGLGGLREHGMYRETRHYVANVMAIRKHLRKGWNPA